MSCQCTRYHNLCQVSHWYLSNLCHPSPLWFHYLWYLCDTDTKVDGGGVKIRGDTGHVLAAFYNWSALKAVSAFCVPCSMGKKMLLHRAQLGLKSSTVIWMLQCHCNVTEYLASSVLCPLFLLWGLGNTIGHRKLPTGLKTTDRYCKCSQLVGWAMCVLFASDSQFPMQKEGFFVISLGKGYLLWTKENRCVVHKSDIWRQAQWALQDYITVCRVWFSFLWAESYEAVPVSWFFNCQGLYYKAIF